MVNSKLQAHQMLSRSADVLATEASGEVALMSIPNGCYYALNPVASDIWRKLERPLAVDALTAQLITGYEGEPAQIEKDLRETLGQWLSFGLITLLADQPAPAGRH